MAPLLDHAEAMTLLQTLPLGVIATDHERVIWINNQAELLTGLNGSALCGQSLEALPVWLKAIFFSGKEQTQLSGESGCEVMASLKLIDAAQVKMACFLSEGSEIRELRNTILEMEKRLELLDTRDDCSGLLNQRGLYQVIESQVSRSRRYGNALSLVSMHIHDFGACTNDKNAVFEALGYLFNDRLRWADSVGHFEGDEFILVLPETDVESASTLAAKLMAELQALRLKDIGVPVTLGVSFGIAAWQEGDDPSRLLLRCQEDRHQLQVMNQ